jgi:type I restriction enzyme, S subunit
MNAASPHGWANCLLGDVVQLKTGPFGSALHQSDYVTNGVPLINPTHIRLGALSPDQSVSVSPAKASDLAEYMLKVGDVVMGRRGEMGRCAVVPGHANGWLCGTGSVIVRPSTAVTPGFLQRFLSAPSTVAALEGDSVGSTMVNLNQKILLNLSVGLPPLPEQQRIADKLDTVLARVDAVNDRLARAAPLLKRFRHSVLAAATSGRLTADWRDGQSTEAPWRTVALGSLSADLRYGTAKKCTADARGIPVLRIPNIGDAGLVNIEELKYAEFDASEKAKLSLDEGDLLIIRSNGSVDLVGRACVIDSQAKGMLFAGYLIRLRVAPDRALPRYVWISLSAPITRSAIESTSRSTSGVNNINSEELKALQVQLPPLDEQSEIVRRVGILFAFADRLEARLQAAQTAASRLTPALLAKAFRGELVPQDPADEPAAELLKRLAAQAAPTAGRPRRAASRRTEPAQE